MTQELTRKPTVVSNRPAPSETKAPWHGLALAVVLILSAFLNLFRLTNVGYGITYYAAAVKNMLTSWSNFFFVSFDAGFVSVDKPPLGLWIQAASAKLLGFDGLSLMLPQAIAGILCVALLYHLVRRAFGPVAGLVAALALAVTPIIVATSRNNTMDMLLVLTVLLAAWAVVRAAESGRLRWLLVGAVLVGLGFNIKMLAAFLVLPAFYLLYLVAAPVAWWRRFVHLGAATVVLVVVSLSWAVVVDLTPADQRPYVGSTSDGTVTNLILGYNGLDRLLGTSFGAEGAAPAGTLGGPGGGDRQNGEPGPFRLLNQQYAGQVGWLLPLAVVGLVAAGRQRRLRFPLDRRHQALVLWGTWFLTAAAYFSIAGGQHRYYTVMLAPAMAALVGVGVVALWNDYRSSGREGWSLPLALVGMAALQAYILAGYEGWRLILTPVIVGLCLIAAAILVILRPEPQAKVGTYAAVATAVGILALLIAPTVWASYTVFEGPRGSMPTAGPPPPQTVADRFVGVGGHTNQRGLGGGTAPGHAQVPFGKGNQGGGLPGGGTQGDASRDAADPALMNFLLANQGDAEYLVAATRSRNTAPVILSTDEPVISLGGYNGVDPVFTTKQLANLVNEGAVRFFLIPDRQLTTQTMPGNGVSRQQPGWQGASPGAPRGASRGGLGNPPDTAQNISERWVQANCKQVPRELWQSPTLGQGGGSSINAQTLYDCGTGSKAADA